MRNRLLALTILCVFVLSIIALTSATKVAQAQSDKPVACDSTLITLVYLAAHDYGYHSTMDMAKFETGQFKPWFDAMMAMGGDKMMGTQPAMMAGTKEAMMEGTKDAGMMAMVELKPGIVQGENASCTALRADVEGYLVKTISAAMMMPKK